MGEFDAFKNAEKILDLRVSSSARFTECARVRLATMINSMLSAAVDSTRKVNYERKSQLLIEEAAFFVDYVMQSRDRRQLLSMAGRCGPGIA